MKQKIRLTQVEAEALRAVFLREFEAAKAANTAERVREDAKERRIEVAAAVLVAHGIDGDPEVLIDIRGALPPLEIEVDLGEEANATQG